MMSPAELLQNVIHVLEQQFTPVVISTWFGDASAVTVKDGVFILLTTSRMKQEMIENRYAQPFCDAVRDLTGSDLALRVLCGDEELSLWKAANEDTVYANYTFERFIVGKNRPVPTTPCLSTASPVWAKPTFSMPSPVTSPAPARPTASSMSRATISPTS